MKSRLEFLDLLPANSEGWDIANTTGYSLRKSDITVPTIDIIISSIVKVYGCLFCIMTNTLILLQKSLIFHQ